MNEPSDQPSDAFWDEPRNEPVERSSSEPPAGEGEAVVIREPGRLIGPYPSTQMVLIAGIEHLAAAWAHRTDELPLDLETGLQEWLRQRLNAYRRDPLRPVTPPGAPPGALAGTPLRPPGAPPGAPPSAPLGAPPSAPPEAPPAGQPDPATERLWRAPSGRSAAAESCRCGGNEAASGNDLSWIGRALSPFGVPARVEHAGLVDARTLELLACNATVRTAVLAPNGALLDLGRTQRLATPAQKTALVARDGGCVIPGCTVPGDACDAHHVLWWTRGGPTDLDNLALACGRHHDEIHHGTWEVEMKDGVPWVTPPTWMDRTRTPLRNAAHHASARGREAP